MRQDVLTVGHLIDMVTEKVTEDNIIVLQL